MKISKTWAMPNKNTFNIKPIKEFIERYNIKKWSKYRPICKYQ